MIRNVVAPLGEKLQLPNQDIALKSEEKGGPRIAEQTVSLEQPLVPQVTGDKNLTQQAELIKVRRP